MSATVDSQVRARSGISVDASTSGVGDTVRQIADLLVGAGAHLDPRLVVLEREGHVTLATIEAPNGVRFIALPRETLIPIDRLVWDDSARHVAVVDGLDSLTGLQRDLLELHLDLWNATRKREEFLDGHPKVAAMTDPALLAAVREVRPSFAADGSTGALLRTRTFALRNESADASSTTTSVVMPILELADHHSDGAPYRFFNDGLGADFTCVDESGVSYVRYGPMRDAFDMACQYGYSTDEMDFFVSAPLELDLEGYGSLSIGRVLNRRQPPEWTVDRNGLAVTYLPLGLEGGMYEALFSPVRAFLDGRGADRATARSLAMRSCLTVLRLNAELMESIHECASASSHHGAAVLADAAVEQWRVIRAVEAMA